MINKINKLAFELKEKFLTSDPEAICGALGIPIVCCELPLETNGFLYSCGDSFAIILSARLKGKFKKYCIAHELGHFLLHKGLNALFIADSTNLVLGKYEREADVFACFLLIGEDVNTDSGTVTAEEISQKTSIPLSAVETWAKFCFEKKRV